MTEPTKPDIDLLCAAITGLHVVADHANGMHEIGGLERVYDEVHTLAAACRSLRERAEQTERINSVLSDQNFEMNKDGVENAHRIVALEKTLAGAHVYACECHGYGESDYEDDPRCLALRVEKESQLTKMGSGDDD